MDERYNSCYIQQHETMTAVESEVPSKHLMIYYNIKFDGFADNAPMPKIWHTIVDLMRKESNSSSYIARQPHAALSRANKELQLWKIF